MSTHLVYDSLYGPSRQMRVKKNRITYHPCILQPIATGSQGFTTALECENSSVCTGANKAYSYMCGANATAGTNGIVKVTGGTGTDLVNTNCWGCQVGVAGSAPVATGGQNGGVCTFQPNGQANINNFNTETLCKSNDKTMCGWQYGCT